jgi:hypothetical protein
VGTEARSRETAHRQRTALGRALRRRTAGAQAMNQIYLDTARLSSPDNS